MRGWCARWLALGLVAVLLACDSSRPAVPRTIVWIVVDTLRADALGAYGFDEPGEGGALASPNLDRLAKEALVFDRAYSAAPWTIPSLVTLLSGAWPFDHGQSRLLEPLDPSLVLLPEVLREAGWRTAGVTTNFVTKASYGFDRGFERFDDGLARGHLGAYGRLAVERLLSQGDGLLAESERAGEPNDDLFLFGLLFEPHYRYELHPGLGFGPGFGAKDGERYAGPLTGQEELADLRSRLRQGQLDGRDLAYLRGCYQSEVALVDEAIARLREGLESRGRWDEALVIVTSDHGELLGEQGWIGHTIDLSKELVRVPLLVKPPDSWGVAPRRVEHAVSHVDLFATVLDAARVDLPGYSQPTSRSLLPTWLADVQPERRYLYLHTDFQPLEESSEFETKRALMYGVLDRDRGVKWVVNHMARDAEGARVVRGTRTPPIARDPIDPGLPGDGRLAGADADLERLRGLVAKPLDGVDGAERLRTDFP